MADDRGVPPPHDRPPAGPRRRATPRKPAGDGIEKSLRLAYAETLAEPLPPELAELLRRLE